MLDTSAFVGERILTSQTMVRVSSGFCYNIDEICAILGCYTLYGGNSLVAFWGNLLVPSAVVKKHMNGTNKLSGNIGKKLPLLTV